MGSKYTRGCCGWLIVALVAALVATAAMFAIMKRKSGGRHLKPLPVPGPPGAIDSKYGDALGVALQFFQVQKCEYPCLTRTCIAFCNSALLSFKLTSIRCFLSRIVTNHFCCFCAAGKLKNNKIPWRGDSALDDGKQAGLDLSKGMYDAGDHIKFSFPMAFTATVLSWSMLEYGDQMSAAKQLDPALDALKWITDFLINAHPSDNVFYIQVRIISLLWIIS
jgi:hypothetical protein